MSQVTIRVLVQQLLRTPRFTACTGWGGGVQRSELARSAHRLFDAEWSVRGHPRIERHQPLGDLYARLAGELLGELEPQLLLIATMTADLLAHVSIECEQSGVSVSLDQISGRCTSAATAHVRRQRRPPTRAETIDLAREITVKVSAIPPRWSAQQFEDRYGARFEHLWNSQGRLSLEQFPPSSLLLGHDRQPPLLPRVARETDACGTDRSVFGRYRSYRPPGLGQRVPFRSRAGRCTQPETRRSSNRDVAAEEVHRACLPYGLEQQPHRNVLRGTHHGLSFERDTAAASMGEDLSTRCVPLVGANEGDIAETIRRLLRDRLRRGEPRPGRAPAILDVDGLHWSVDGPVQLSGELEHVTRVVMRRLWKAVHGLELYVDECMCSCSLKAVAAVALDRAVPAAKDGWQDPCEDRSACRTTPELAEHIAVQNRTCALLMDHPQLAKSLLTRQPGWENDYRDLVAGEPEKYLSTQDFAQWCMDLIPGVSDNDQEES